MARWYYFIIEESGVRGLACAILPAQNSKDVLRDSVFFSGRSGLTKERPPTRRNEPDMLYGLKIKLLSGEAAIYCPTHPNAEIFYGDTVGHNGQIRPFARCPRCENFAEWGDHGRRREEMSVQIGDLKPIGLKLAQLIRERAKEIQAESRAQYEHEISVEKQPYPGGKGFRRLLEAEKNWIRRDVNALNAISLEILRERDIPINEGSRDWVLSFIKNYCDSHIHRRLDVLSKEPGPANKKMKKSDPIVDAAMKQLQRELLCLKSEIEIQQRERLLQSN